MTGVQTCALPISVKAGVAEDALKSLSADFTVDSFSTFTITWMNGEDEESATIHWGYYEGSDFNEFSSTTTVDLTAASADLAVKVDGYYYVGSEYKATEDADAVNLKSSVIKKADGKWTVTDEEGTTVTVADGSHI